MDIINDLHLDRRYIIFLLEGLQRASARQEENEVAISELGSLLKTSNASPQSVQSAFARVETTSQATLLTLQACGVAREDVWQPTADSLKVAQKVFSIPELCELILGRLEKGQDLLHATQANKTMAAVARGSPAIQQRLGFAHNKKGFWHTPFSSGMFEYFECSMLYQSPYLRQYNEGPSIDAPTISATFFPRAHVFGPALKDHILPHIADAYRNVQICTPPIRKMECKVRCCSDWRPPSMGLLANGTPNNLPPPNPIAPLVNADGLTVGDLYDATVRLMDEHRLCAHAALRTKLDKNGFVQARPTFEGTLKLLEDDPVVASSRKELVDTERWRTKYEADKAWLSGYIVAKQNAFIGNEPIPTAAEYAASISDPDALEAIVRASAVGYC